MLVSALLNHQQLDKAIMAWTRSCGSRRIVSPWRRRSRWTSGKEIAASLVTRAGEWSAERLKIAAEDASSALLVQARQEAARAEGGVTLAGLGGFPAGRPGIRVTAFEIPLSGDRKLGPVINLRPNDAGDELSGGQEVPRGLLVAGGDGAKLLDLGEEVLDQMARRI